MSQMGVGEGVLTANLGPGKPASPLVCMCFCRFRKKESLSNEILSTEKESAQAKNKISKNWTETASVTVFAACVCTTCVSMCLSLCGRSMQI
jgi:hypothetical protein